MGISNPESATPAAVSPSGASQEITRLRDLTAEQKKSGLAAWLGWMFDGLDMHLYNLVALPFVAELLRVPGKDTKHPDVGTYSSLIQAAFLIGWALGGSFFGRIADRIGRSKALMLTILTYAMFTGLSYFATEWWHLLAFRFLAALGIGGEWAVGASLISETWPRRWRPWLAAILQTGVNIGVILAIVATDLLKNEPNRTVFLVGIFPALLVLWIRRAVPETEEWVEARQQAQQLQPVFRDLFRGPVRRITILTLLVCAFSLTAHWAYMFWCLQHVHNLEEISEWSPADKQQLKDAMFLILILGAIAGNFFAAFLAKCIRYRWAISSLCMMYFLSMFFTYLTPLSRSSLYIGFAAMGISQGVFALFTMYLPPLFPTLLRTTGAGFCYNIGRIAAGLGTVLFGLLSRVDFRMAMLYASFLFIPAALIALLLPEPPDENVPADKIDGILLE